MASGENQQIAILFQKLADGTASREELHLYFQLCTDQDLEAKIKELMSEELTKDLQAEEADLERMDQVYRNIRKSAAIQKPKVYQLWPRIAIAAAVAAIIFGAGLFYFKLNTNKAQPEQLAGHHDIAPGKSGATLTLASGQKIRLSDALNGKLAEEAGVSITKSATGQLVYELKDQSAGVSQMNLLTTAKGETYQVHLPDGSRVWLNSASSLKYPANLTSAASRRVQLTGEGYFEIAKDKAHPFIVETGSQEVEVLGTHFNVNSYADEPAVMTTLVEGSVKVRAGSKEKIIRPGEQATSSGGGLNVRKVDIGSITDWKDGEFNLEGVDFKVAMRKIARWYDVQVIYDQNVPDNIVSGGWISRDVKLSTILEGITRSGLVHFKLEGRRLYVSR